MCFFSIVTRFLIIMFGLLRPARYTQQAVDTSQEHEMTAWSKYWVVYATLVCVELLGDSFFAWMPLYAETKLLIVLWLIVSAPQASVWVFDTILNPLLLRHAPKIDHFLVHGKSHLLSDLLTYTSECCVHSLNAVLPVVSQLWRKPRHRHTDDPLAALDNMDNATSEDANETFNNIEPLTSVEDTRSYTNQYMDTKSDDVSYDVTFPSSQSQGHINVAQRKANFAKLSIPDLNKKLTTQLGAMTRPKRKQFVYDRQLDDVTLKDVPMVDAEESLQNQVLATERALRPVQHSKDRERYQ
ncbi:hypothetical protein KR093_002033 [Drosophila rubida]|uniref:Receptor expression-enhancing protein n=1 Tax=Drosophila rubida TaxID=30044 RepID=A0AAD4PIX3_9MUSC|nr:hypothetical protein KR093_002033 [Drosophila rubida]